MARYLLTGVAGFIGSQVAVRLLREGHDVVGVDNLNDAYDVRLKEWRLKNLEGLDRLTFHRTDITDRGQLERLFAGAFDAVIDFDAALRDPAKPEQVRRDCVSKDNIHPNDKGHRVMADSIDMQLLK